MATAVRPESEREQAILDALPANIALLNSRGIVTSVNAAWRSFADANTTGPRPSDIGRDYLAVCADATGPDAADIHAIGDGILSVLRGAKVSFSTEYACHSPAERRWFLMTATPIGNDGEGALVRHLDITERKRSALAFAELSERTERRERMLSVLLSSMNDFAYIFDRDGRILFANQRLLDLLGITLDRIVGKNFFDLEYPPDLAARLQRQIQEVLITQKVVRDETRFVGADGLEGYYEYVFSPVIASDSSAEFVVGSTRDVTERKRVEVELRDRDEKFNQLANNIDDVFWIRSADMSELHYLSPAFETIWGRPKCTLESDPLLWGSFILPDDRERVETAFHSLTTGSESVDEEYRIFRPDGEMRWVRSRGFRVNDDDGTHIRNIGIVTDTTERRSAEEALRHSQKRLRDVFNGLGPSLFVGLLTTEGIVVEINRSPLEAADLEASDVIGKPFVETHWWSHSADAQRLLREAITRAKAGEASRFDMQLRGTGEERIEIDFSLQPLRDESGNIAFLVPSANVITERKVAEEALRQAQKMEAVGQLAAGVAHEFNNLMQALMSMSTMMRLRAIDPESAKIGSDIESLIKRGAGLTQQLLLFSRHRPIEKSALDLGDELRKASELLRHLIPETINIAVDIADTPLHAQGDAGQIQQVLLNLAINARDAMPDGGTLTMRAGRAGHDVFQEVEDTGLGIDAETRHHLFEPFFTTKGPAKGTGLGLAVAHGIVQQHGGRIEVHTTLGDGSRFRVLLPESILESTLAVAAGAEEIAPGGGKRLLLLEDDASVRDGLSALLEWVGYNVVTASNGEEALALVMDPPPNLFLSDVTLPGIGGPATAKQLRERWPELKVVLMSGYADDAMRATASNEGWHFLQKPFEFADLERMLRIALLAHSYRGERSPLET